MLHSFSSLEIYHFWYMQLLTPKCSTTFCPIWRHSDIKHNQFMPSIAASSLVQMVIAVYFYKTWIPPFLLLQNQNAHSTVNIKGVEKRKEREETRNRPSNRAQNCFLCLFLQRLAVKRRRKKNRILFSAFLVVCACCRKQVLQIESRARGEARSAAESPSPGHGPAPRKVRPRGHSAPCRPRRALPTARCGRDERSAPLRALRWAAGHSRSLGMAGGYKAPLTFPPFKNTLGRSRPWLYPNFYCLAALDRGGVREHGERRAVI